MSEADLFGGLNGGVSANLTQRTLSWVSAFAVGVLTMFLALVA
jgi:hypothetical protein